MCLICDSPSLGSYCNDCLKAWSLSKERDEVRWALARVRTLRDNRYDEKINELTRRLADMAEKSKDQAKATVAYQDRVRNLEYAMLVVYERLHLAFRKGLSLNAQYPHQPSLSDLVIHLDSLCMRRDQKLNSL